MKNNNQQKSPGCLYILFCVFVWMPFLVALIFFAFALLITICSKIHPAVLVLILIAIVAAAGYVLYKKHEKKKQAEENHMETVLQRTVDYPDPIKREPRQAPQPPDGLYEQDHLAKLAADQDDRETTNAHYQFIKPAPKPKEPLPNEGVRIALRTLEEAKQKRDAENAHYGTVFLDIETTSYNDNSAKYDNDILQVSIIDENEDVLIDQYCKPRKKESWENASKINSIYFLQSVIVLVF